MVKTGERCRTTNHKNFVFVFHCRKKQGVTLQRAVKERKNTHRLNTETREYIQSTTRCWNADHRLQWGNLAEKGKWTKNGFSVGFYLGDRVCGCLEDLHPKQGRVTEVKAIMPGKDTIGRPSSHTTDSGGRYSGYFGTGSRDAPDRMRICTCISRMDSLRKRTRAGDWARCSILLPVDI